MENRFPKLTNLPLKFLLMSARKAVQCPNFRRSDLEFMGVKMDEDANKVRGEERVISAPDSKVTVLLIPTNEELMIAMDTEALVG